MSSGMRFFMPVRTVFRLRFRINYDRIDIRVCHAQITLRNGIDI